MTLIGIRPRNMEISILTLVFKIVYLIIFMFINEISMNHRKPIAKYFNKKFLQYKA